MELPKISHGIYHLGEFDIEKEKTIAVHPFFIDQERELYPEYFKNLEKFIEEYPGLLITLESNSGLKSAVKTFTSLNRDNNSLFIKTTMYDPHPYEIGFKGLLKFIKKFKKEELKLIGGYLTNEFRNDNRGCLGFVEKKLKKAKIKTKLLEELVFD
jgi:hypothetical protein